MRSRTVFAAIALTALLVSGCGGSSNNGSSDSGGSTSDGSGDLAAPVAAQTAAVEPFVQEVARNQEVTESMVASLIARIAELPPGQQQEAANAATRTLKLMSSGELGIELERDVYRRAAALIGEAQKGLAGGQGRSR